MEWRHLTEFEKALLDKLLSISFIGRDELVAQIQLALVRQVDEEGSVEFNIDSSTPSAQVERRIPIEMQAKDQDGIWVHALLHVVHGRVKELALYKDDSSRIVEKPQLEDWELIKLG